jgi:hypothetical protein
MFAIKSFSKNKKPLDYERFIGLSKLNSRHLIKLASLPHQGPKARAELEGCLARCRAG